MCLTWYKLTLLNNYSITSFWKQMIWFSFKVQKNNCLVIELREFNKKKQLITFLWKACGKPFNVYSIVQLNSEFIKVLPLILTPKWCLTRQKHWNYLTYWFLLIVGSLQMEMTLWARFVCLDSFYSITRLLGVLRKI
jgi:hypothetical protein